MMKQTIRNLLLLTVMIIAGAGQVWANQPDPTYGILGYSSENAATDGGVLEFYNNADCVEDDNGNHKLSENEAVLKSWLNDYRTVYIKAISDVSHTVYGMTASDITVRAATSSGGTEAPRRTNGLVLGESIEVTAVDGKPGVFQFTMPEDEKINVSVSATFPEKAYQTAVKYIDATGIATTTADGVKVYVLDGTESVLGVSTATDGTWYVLNSNQDYFSQLTINGHVHLILADGKTMNVSADGNYGIKATNDNNGYTDNLTIYGQSGQSGKLTTQGERGGIYVGDLTICGGDVTGVPDENPGFNADGNFTVYGGKVDGTIEAHKVIINGGQVTAIVSGNNNQGIRSGTDITLGWTDAEKDFIQAGSYGIGSNSTLKIADGQRFVAYTVSGTGADNDPIVESPAAYINGGLTLTYGQYSYLAGKKLSPMSDAIAQSLTYVDANGTEQNIFEDVIANSDPVENLTANDFLYVLQGNETQLGAWNESVWYISNTGGEGLRYNDQLNVTGDAHLILADNSKMTIVDNNGSSYGFYSGVNSGPGFTIYGQADSNGFLDVSSNFNGFYLGCKITICGGNIKVTDTKYGINVSPGDVVITGGTVTVTSEIYAISCGANVTISGGNVTAMGTETDSYGIYASNSITLGWTKPGDFMQISSFDCSNVKTAANSGTGEETHVNRFEALSVSGTGTESDPIVETLAAYINGDLTLTSDQLKFLASKKLTPMSDATAQNLTYVDANGTEQNIFEDVIANSDPVANLTANDFLYVLQGNEETLGESTATDGMWYVCNSDVSYTNSLTLNGNVNIIIPDGQTLSVGTADSQITGSGITAAKDISFFGQANATGKIYVNSQENGIYNDGGSITITCCDVDINCTGNNGIRTQNNQDGITILGKAEDRKNTIKVKCGYWGIFADGGPLSISYCDVDVVSAGMRGISSASSTYGRITILGRADGSNTVKVKSEHKGIYAENCPLDIRYCNIDITCADEESGKSWDGIESGAVNVGDHSGITITGVADGSNTVKVNCEGYSISSSDCPITITNCNLDIISTKDNPCIRGGGGNITITGCADGSNTVNITSISSLATIYDTDNGDTFTLSNCKANISNTGTYRAIWIENVTIDGGQVKVTAQNADAIYMRGGTLTLGWRNSTDFIQASSYNVSSMSGSSMKTADGQRFVAYTVSGNGTEDAPFVEAASSIISGTITGTNVATVNDKLLRPLDGKYVATTSNHVTFSDNYTRKFDMTNAGVTTHYYIYRPSTMENPVNVTLTYDNEDGELLDVTGLPFSYYFDNDNNSFTMPNEDINLTLHRYMTGVKYMDWDHSDPNDNTSPMALVEKETDTEGYYPEKVYVLEGDETELSPNDPTWLLAKGTLNYTNGLTLSKDTHLILADNATMNIGTSDNILNDVAITGNGGSLSIYTQSVPTTEEVGEDDNKTTTVVDNRGVLNIYANGTGIDLLDGSLNLTNVILKVSANSGDGAIYVRESGVGTNNLNIIGGQIDVANNLADGKALKVTNTPSIILNWAHASDAIKASSYEGTVKIPQGRAFYAEGTDNVYGNSTADYVFGDGTNATLAAIADKTLRPTKEISTGNETATNKVAYIDVCTTEGNLELAGDDDTKLFAVVAVNVDGSIQLSNQPVKGTSPGTPLIACKVGADGKPSGVALDNSLNLRGVPEASIVPNIKTGASIEKSIVKAGPIPQFVAAATAEMKVKDLGKKAFEKAGKAVLDTHLKAFQMKSGKFVSFRFNDNTLAKRGKAMLFMDIWELLNMLKYRLQHPNAPRLGLYIDLGDDDLTAIEELARKVVDVRDVSDSWYTLDGRKLDKQPTAKGMYINNGRKVVIK